MPKLKFFLKKQKLIVQNKAKPWVKDFRLPKSFPIFEKTNSSALKKTLVLFAHPYLEYSNNNIELINFYERHQQYTFRDLYEEYPDFHIHAFRERKRIMEYERLIFHFPLIWFGVPPLLKLWMDEVFDLKWINHHHEKPLKGKEAVILVTAGGSEKEFSKNGTYGFTIAELLSSLTATLKICGIKLKIIYTVYEADRLDKKEIINHKKTFAEILSQ